MTTTFPSTTPPPIAQTGPIAWLRKNLFSNWFSTLLTLLILGVIVWWAIGFVNWAFGLSGQETAARWDVIPRNMALFFVGRYPAAQRWRTWIILGLLALMSGLTWGVLTRNSARLFTRNVLIGIGGLAVLTMLLPVPPLNHALLLAFEGLVLVGAGLGRWVGRSTPKLANGLPAAWLLSYLLIFWLLAGGLGLRPVSGNDWGGLTLNLFIAFTSIVLCFPMGVLLALGRRSDLPVVRWICTLFIELVRGVPLITLLFFGKFIFPDFLPVGSPTPDNLLRAIVVLAMFSAAYLAENVRGGLQSIPRGQTEASQALGLNPFLTTALIVLPQALKVSIPAIVGQFISLFQDTTLLYLVDVQELLNMSNAVISNPQFLGRRPEVYLFIGTIFWFFCYAMSMGSRWLEKSLSAEYRPAVTTIAAQAKTES